jgi:hypothetical protein
MRQNGGGQGDLGERFRNPDNGLQLTNSDWDRTSLVVVAFDLLDLFPQADKVATKQLGSFGR